MSVKSEILCTVILDIIAKLCEWLVLSSVFWFLTALLFSNYPSNVSTVYYYIHGKKKGRRSENYFPPGNELSFRSHVEPALCIAWEAKGANKKIWFPQSWGPREMIGHLNLPRVQRTIRKGFAKKIYLSVSVQIESTFKYYVNYSLSCRIYQIIKIIISEKITSIAMRFFMCKVAFYSLRIVYRMADPLITEPKAHLWHDREAKWERKDFIGISIVPLFSRAFCNSLTFLTVLPMYAFLDHVAFWPSLSIWHIHISLREVLHVPAIHALWARKSHSLLSSLRRFRGYETPKDRKFEKLLLLAI